jgi:hypothetical protein
MKVQAFFKKASAPAKTAAPAKGGKAAKAAPKPAKSTGPKKNGGWLGSDSQSQDLSKW